jgi:DNA-binding transcriptional LysR family regulator
MELRHLRYFRVFAEELHFGRAAARLHMEPQPLNFQMRQLERELGFPLITRKENHSRLTAAGKVLAAEATKVLGAVDAAVDAARRAARGESGVLRLGHANTSFYNYLMPTIKHFRDEYPTVSFDLQSVFVSDQLLALRQGRLDIGINLLPCVDPAFESKPIISAPPILAVSVNDPLARQTSVEWRQLHGLPEVVLVSATPVPLQDRVHAMLADRGVELRFAQTARDDNSLFALIAMGIGVAILPFEPRDAPKDVAFLRLPEDAPSFVYGTIWIASDENPLRDRFIEQLPTLAASAPTNR